MTDADRKVLRRAARCIETHAKHIHDAETFASDGHPHYGEFPDDADGRWCKKEYETMMSDAKALRAIARRKV